MTEAIIVAIITGVFSLIGVVVTCAATAWKMKREFEIQQAVMQEKITELTREVREHNNFARRVPVVEEQIKILMAERNAT